MHYVMTGGCGFIGSHLVERLIAAKHRVTVLDDLSSGKRDNIPAVATFVEGDITTPDIFDALVKDADGIFHLAAISSVMRSQTEWLHTHQVNLGGTVAIFDALAKAKHTIPVVYASSAAVYGDCDDMPIRETSACKPLSAYGVDKFGCEQQARIASSTHAIPTMGLRFFNVYGGRQDPSSPYSGVISIFTDRMYRGEPITIYSDGKQVRDFIHVSDVVTSLALAMNHLHKDANASGVYNIATGQPTTINDLADIIRGITQSHSNITHAAPRAGDIRLSVGDTKLAQMELGFTAITPLAEGLRQTLAAAA
jgi:UDP-glucose 4-epimerase